MNKILAQADEEYQAFCATHEVAHLDAAIDAERKALDLCPKGHRGRHVCLHNLASTLDVRYQWTDNLEDLTEAIQMLQEVLQMLPPDHPAFSSVDSKLAASLDKQLQRIGIADDPVKVTRTSPIVATARQGSDSSVERNSVGADSLDVMRLAAN